MGFGIKLRVWGEYACFTRPEMKSERVSYDVITPSAARGIIESIYWKPSIRWVIDKITVMSVIPAEFGNIMINEVKSKSKRPPNDLDGAADEILDNLTIYTRENNEISQRRMMFLKNPDYIIEAHFESSGVGDDAFDFKKHYNMVLRRAENGQCYKQPVFGMRNFSANFKLIKDDDKIESPLKGDIDFGYMLYDIDFKKDKNGKALNAGDPIFYRAKMRDGVIDVAECYKQGGHQ
ncbi:MAG: type I-C CRISPR-associated protein Cas5c [Christensenellaceae bacterium]|jgi:CRISPR-associated protein Cas5d|nr:type I-C CRISPR-associated protein Cas5c [Christensenellaceae bacterium]